MAFESCDLFDQYQDKVVLHCCGHSNVFDICALQNSDPSDVIYTSGCIEQGEVWVNHNLIPVAGVFVGLALVQVCKLLLKHFRTLEVRGHT